MYSALRHMSVFLILLYLFVPVMGFAHTGIAEIRARTEVVDSGCDHCPCNDEQGKHCCDSTNCGCSFQSPPEQGFQINYVPVVIVDRHREPFWILPQVYLSIFVPPQNQSRQHYVHTDPSAWTQTGDMSSDNATRNT
jgi:hypothetical protein